MPRIRDLGITFIPTTMRPPEIGAGGGYGAAGAADCDKGPSCIEPSTRVPPCPDPSREVPPGCDKGASCIEPSTEVPPGCDKGASCVEPSTGMPGCDKGPSCVEPSTDCVPKSTPPCPAPSNSAQQHCGRKLSPAAIEQLRSQMQSQLGA